MNKRIIATILLLWTTIAHSTQVPPELSEAVNIAERDGRILFEASKKPTDPGDDIVSTARERVTDFCSYEYDAVVVSKDQVPIVYFIAHAANDQSIVYGRHYKVSSENVATSTKGCVKILPDPRNAVASFITHLLSEEPSEFHVYLSLKHQKAIYVGTSYGIWAVESGTIRFMKKR